LDEIRDRDPGLAEKIYLLEDCTSPVVVPGAVDYTDNSNTMFKQFAEERINIVQSITPMTEWPGIEQSLSLSA
jgi:hypothetical protein